MFWSVGGLVWRGSCFLEVVRGTWTCNAWWYFPGDASFGAGCTWQFFVSNVIWVEFSDGAEVLEMVMACVHGGGR